MQIWRDWLAQSPEEARDRMVNPIPGDASSTAGGDAEPYEMKISMSVLEALGINLYSNAAAVISELVANAWDADANLVEIAWQSSDGDSFVEIRDDGCGMTRSDLKAKFLTVGYAKRVAEGGLSSKYSRAFMGRKGIGKLSVFSIADTVEVHSARNDERNALRIEVDDLKRKIETDEPYNPEEIPPRSDLGAHGTIIHLGNLRRQRIGIAINALRKRVARRFDILTLAPPASGSTSKTSADDITQSLSELRQDGGDLSQLFFVTINDAAIDFDDRVELKKLEYFWEFGKSGIPDANLPPGVSRILLGNIVDGNPQWKVTGWIGTTVTPSQLTDDEEAGSLKNIMVLSRGRPIQEGIIERLDLSRIFLNYVTGQIRADFLDTDSQDDIATSDRQRLMEDDPRVTALQKFLRDALLKASDTWSDLRPKKKAKEVLARYPVVRKWVDSLPVYQQQPAQKFMGMIESLSIPESSDDEKDRRRLFQSGIVAFERIGLREDLEKLNQLSSLESVDILHVLGTLDGYEAAMYLDIIRARVETIDSFADDVSGNALEKVLQESLHSNLWLLDPAWDRITQDVKMEEHIYELAQAFGAKRPDEDALKRTDIRYCNVQNRHVIIELKRAKVKLDTDVLYDQGLTYVKALADILDETGRGAEPYEVIFVVGDKPTAKKSPPGKKAEDYTRERISELPGRVFRYQELIHSARAQYSEYMDKNKDLTRVAQVLDALADKSITDQ
ncbi:BbrUII/HgiDII family restriction enzyme [Nocardia colli]|uniref:BbrUII/HgiDII family restriction enzyme n=1 Tax=Nocardia colli TaxID=2545717 RepID=UPI0035DD3505